MFTVKANRSSVHIAGITERTKSAGEERGGVVGYYAESACGALTRNGRRMQGLGDFEELADALRKARGAAASISGRKVCKTCETAATAQLGQQD
jgi:hypothetical protein